MKEDTVRDNDIPDKPPPSKYIFHEINKFQKNVL